ncbi:MAG: ACP S-malonyltransferase [Chthonomonas sp.]|nr:ACP S-malonyltransferase [Chthonomonas sp.]
MFAVVFPGQGSQKPGMARELAEQNAAAAQVFDQVSEATGQDLRQICWELSEDDLRQTQNAQLALFTAGLAGWYALAPSVGKPSAFAGHSVGEYAALVASGALSVAEGAKLVQTRGKLMASAGATRPGGMAAVLGLDSGPLSEVCLATSTEGSVVVVANDNCPGQVVVSGDKDAVGRIEAAAVAAGAKRVLPLNVSGAFHSPLMADPALAMGQAATAANWTAQHTPVYANVTAQAVADSAAWAALLEQQLLNAVRWRESVEAMLAAGITHFAECGGGEVLGGLLRRINKEAVSVAVQDAASLAAAPGILES